MKITAITKDRDENSSRAEFFGLNLHSNGNFFSRSSLIFLDQGCCCCYCCCGSGGIVWRLFALYIKWSDTLLFSRRIQTQNFHYVPKYYGKNIILFTSRCKFKFVVRSAASTFRVTVISFRESACLGKNSIDYVGRLQGRWPFRTTEM